MINPLDGNKAQSRTLFSKTKSSDSKGKKVLRDKPSFLRLFESVQEPALSECPLTEKEIATLLDEIYQTGHELVRFPCLKNIQDYKKKIGLFLRAIVHDAVELTEVEGSLRKDMKKPKYALIQVINEKLDKLCLFVLQEQKDKLELLDRINELQGLLIDLKH